ncbi:Transcription factor bHLH25, partial [Bienertia sinuspersici]
MEASRFSSFNDMELDDLSFMDHLQMDTSFEEIFAPSFIPETSENINTSFEQQINEDEAMRCNIYTKVDVHTIIEEKPMKQLNTNNCNNSYKINNLALSSEHEAAASTSIMLSFDNSSNFSHNRALNDHPQVAKETSPMAILSQHSKDHILAERRHREKLNERFIALSTIIPGLKKTDKATVLGDAYKYVKQLEEKVKTLEEVTKSKTIETAILVNQTVEDASSRFSTNGQCPEIEVKFSNKDVLIRIHCEMKNRVVEKLISQIENLHLVIANSNVLVFGCGSLDATFVAQ